MLGQNERNNTLHGRLSWCSWKQFRKVLKLRSGLCQGLKLLENCLIIEILEYDQFDTCVHNDMNMCAFCISEITQKLWARKELGPDASQDILFSLEQVLQIESNITRNVPSTSHSWRAFSSF